MTMHEEWTDKLSEYLDGELSPEDRGAVDAHLRECSDCARVLDDLRRVVARAQAIPARPPQADLWPGVERRIERVRAPRRIQFTLPQLAAAATLLAAVSGGLAWSVAARVDAHRAAAVAAVAADAAARAVPDSFAVDPAVETVGFADAQYDAAVADLEKALQQGRGRLDASTIAIVEHNLQTIDQAIAQAREALVADPANSYLSSHLLETRRRKLDLLRRATALVNEAN